MDKEFNQKFLMNRDSTGRFIVKSLRTGKSYYVEPISSSARTDWGDLDPVTKKMTGNYGTKYKGSIKPEESMITKENGFGESPLSYIERIDNKYFEEMNQ